MLTSLESGLGLDIVVGLQKMGSPLLDTLAEALHFLGGDLFYLLIIPLLYWSVSKHLGRRTFFLLTVTLLAAVALKLLVRSPRPYDLFPDLVSVKVDQPGYGIPSGHVTLALALWGYLIVQFRRPRLWWILVVYLAVLGWSRLYAGVHYPQDVVAGLLVGGVCLWLALRRMDSAARWWRELSPALRAGLVILAAVALAVLLQEDRDGLSGVGILLGGGLGALWEEQAIHFSTAGSRQQRTLRYIVGLILLAVIFFGLRALLGDSEPQVILRVARYSIVALFGVGVWPWLCLRTGLAARES